MDHGREGDLIIKTKNPLQPKSQGFEALSGLGLNDLQRFENGQLLVGKGLGLRGEFLKVVGRRL